MINPVATSLPQSLEPYGFITGSAANIKHQQDWSGLPPTVPLGVVYPRNTQDVAQVLQHCQRHLTPVVTQGGLTGLAGGAHPTANCVVLSTEKMCGVSHVDTVMGTLTAWAGTPLQEIQNAAEAEGLYFPIDLGSRGSCTIGGNLATNAGGNKVIRYGMTREHVLGLECALADGSVLSSMNHLLKNNTGYDLKQLLIGSEGTLGVITQVVLRLQAKPLHQQSAMCRCDSFEQVLHTLQHARKYLGPGLSAFEVMWPEFIQCMTTGLPQLRYPFAQKEGFHILIEEGHFASHPQGGGLQNCLAELLESAVLCDVVMAQSEQDNQDLWAIRDSVAEYGKVLGPIIGFDIGLPTPAMQASTQAMQAAIHQQWPKAVVLFFGHVGDCNLHVVVHVPGMGDAQPHHAVESLVYSWVEKVQGSVSAEHGVGLIKKPFLSCSRQPAEIALMKVIKQALDPHHLLNPGKIFDLPSLA
jgi:FAD/FMN-containing dehydrogenase